MTGPARIRTAAVAERMRARIVRPETREILVSRLGGSAQEADLTSPVNCGGIGRVRHFRRATAEGWPENFLPGLPAEQALGLPRSEVSEAQVFQNAACAWRCWYCYVPFEMLGGNPRKSEWVTADDLVRRYAEIEDRPRILDLSGGSPDLTPEWIVWTIEALERRGIADDTFLWSDDNLSTSYFFDALDEGQRRRIAANRRVGRVCCLKGFDPASFAFNTGAEEGGFDRQLELLARYLEAGLAPYLYVTLTGPDENGVEERTAALVAKLVSLSPDLPGRTVPLRIEPFGPMIARGADRDLATPLRVQERAVAAWNALVRGPSPC